MKSLLILACLAVSSAFAFEGELKVLRNGTVMTSAYEALKPAGSRGPLKCVTFEDVAEVKNVNSGEVAAGPVVGFEILLPGPLKTEKLVIEAVNDAASTVGINNINSLCSSQLYTSILVAQTVSSESKVEVNLQFRCQRKIQTVSYVCEKK